MPPNYQNAKIYKLYSYENDDVYYGSTVEKLSQRFSHHISDFKKYKEGKKNYITCFEILQLKSVMIELVELCPCNTKEELLQSEGYYIRNKKCVNKIIPDRKQKEYREDNKEKIVEKRKLRYQENKEKIREQTKKYYEEHKDFLKEYMKKYRESNIQYIKKYNKNRRLKYLDNKDKKKQYYLDNKDKIKQYREDNKDKRKQYYQDNKDKIKQYREKYKRKQDNNKIMN
jgi:hypothetical protein